MSRNTDRDFIAELMEEFEISENQRISTLINALEEDTADEEDDSDEE
jgi:hypothetical protein